MKKQNFKLLIIILILPLVLTGCISVKKKSGGNDFAGIFRSDTKGETWQNITSIYTVGSESRNFAFSNITSLVFDELDDSAIYLGSQHDGLFYTYNYGGGWFNVLSGKGTVNDIVVDPQRNCTIFTAIHNTIYKSVDCARTWDSVYFETREGKYITSLGINGNNNSIVYASNSDGDLLKSTDYGRSWSVLKRFNNYIKDIIIQNHSNSNIMYIVTSKNGIFRSSDAGDNWSDLMALPVDQAEVEEEEFVPFGSLNNSKVVLYLNQDKSVSDGLIYVNKIGIFRLTDNNKWKQIKLLSAQGGDTIYSAVVNPENTNEIFYGTSKGLYHSIDNGNSWDVKGLPTSNVAKILEFSPDNRFIYLTGYKIKK